MYPQGGTRDTLWEKEEEEKKVKNNRSKESYSKQWPRYKSIPRLKKH